ncbi:MAG: dTDP-glucose 4,6-dehydratase [Candidatus Omnitrophica bacterium]|nr:dTDP-glucose 4,6-dehydratase [Candidatus Omnitrophota bacterium]MCM8816416.1 dTDP-glucose 4,6-dehydratase [Candidatus Omnitrophota bacterium]
MKIAITGGVGFIGSNFISFFCKKHPEIQIVNIDKMTYAANPLTLEILNTFSNHKFFKIDICDTTKIEKALEECDFIIHFAAETHVDRSFQNAQDFLVTDVIGTFRILEFIRKKKAIKKYIHISTDEVYGSIKIGSFSESSPLNPTNPYAASKASADLLVLSYIKCYQIPAIIARFTNNFGPFQHPEKFIPLAITNAIENKKIPIYGDGTQVRDWLFVEDTCRALEVLIEKGVPGNIYNVSACQEKQNLEVVQKILKLLGKKENLIVHIPDRVAHDKRYSLSCEKIKEIGFLPSFDFEKGLEITVKWYLENFNWWKTIKDSKEFKTYYKSRYPDL